MDERLILRLKHWLTPGRPLSLPAVPTPSSPLKPGFRLHVLDIDALSRLLPDPLLRDKSFERLRDRLFPNLRLRLDAGDIEDIREGGSELWLSAATSLRWLSAAGRGPGDVAFSFMHLPFAISVDAECRCAGWVVPPSSRSVSRHARLHAGFRAERVTLQLVPGPGSGEDPASVVRAAHLS